MPALQGHTLVHVAMLATAAVATPSFVIQNDQVGAPKLSFSNKAYSGTATLHTQPAMYVGAV